VDNYTGYLTKQPRKAGMPDYIGKAEICGEYRIEGAVSGGSIFMKFFEVDPPNGFKGEMVTKMVTVRAKKKPLPKGMVIDHCAPSLPQKEKSRPTPRPKPVPMEKPVLVCRTCSKLERCIVDSVKPDKSFSCFKPM